METATQHKPNVQIAGDPESLARQAVRLFVSAALDAIRSRGRFYVAVSGGRTPKRFFELLAAKRLVVLVSGQEKAQTLKEVLTGRPDEAKYPIHILWPALDKIIWLVDRDAAGLVVSD